MPTPELAAGGMHWRCHVGGRNIFSGSNSSSFKYSLAKAETRPRIHLDEAAAPAGAWGEMA
eukprot:3386532-Alexandrium_andersonii.AAC.1